MVYILETQFKNVKITRWEWLTSGADRKSKHSLFNLLVTFLACSLSHPSFPLISTKTL